MRRTPRRSSSGRERACSGAPTGRTAASRRRGLRRGRDLESGSESVALLAVQGPRSADILSASRRLGGLSGRVRDLLYYRFAPGDGRETLLVSRTGYTGELGYEIYMPAARA